MDMPSLPPQIKTKKFWIILVIGVFIVAKLIGWLWHHSPASNTVKVTVTPVLEASIAPNFETSGTIVARNSTAIKSQVTGILVKIPVERGQEVSENQLLFEIDPRTFEAAVAQAQATLLKDQATAVNNNDHYKRYQILVKKGFVSKDDYEQVKANKLAADAQVAMDEAALQTAKLQLEYTQITAPFTGRISDIPNHVGDLIGINGSTALTTLNQIKPVDASFSLPSTVLPQLTTVGLSNIKVIATPAANKNYHTTGKLYFIDNQIDPTTGSLAMKAAFANQDEALWPGEFVGLHLSFPVIPHSLLVPTIAIQQNQDQKYYVYIVDKSHIAHLVFVQLGAVEADKTAITQGVKAGDLIITKGQFEISDKSKVSY